MPRSPESHLCLSNPDLLYLVHSHLTSSDLINCLTVSKLWNHISRHHLWSSNPLFIPSRKSNSFLRSRLPKFSEDNQQLTGPSAAPYPPIRDLVLNLSTLNKNSILVKECEDFDLNIIFPAIRSLSLVNTLLLSPFIHVPLPQNPDSASNYGNLVHRSHKQHLRRMFHQNLVKQISMLTELAHINLINFEPSSALGATPILQEDRDGIPGHRQSDINDMLLALADAFSQQAPGKPEHVRRTALKSLNITKSHELVDSSLVAFSRLAPLYSTYQHRQLSFNVSSITLFDCPSITARGFVTFLRTCPNLVSLKLGKMDNLFRPTNYSELSKDQSSLEPVLAPLDREGQRQLGIVEELARYCSQLRYLTIEDINVPLTISAGTIDPPISVINLSLTRCQPTAAFLTSFVSLCELRLNHCAVDDPSRRDYGFLARSFSQLQSLTLFSVGTRSFTFNNLDELLVTSLGLRTFMIDGNGRALQATEEEMALEASDCELDLLAEAFIVQKAGSYANATTVNDSDDVHILPASVRSVFGEFDILASQVPSNVLVLLISAGSALEGVGLFGQADEVAQESNCVIEEKTSVEPPLQLAGRLLDRLKRWSDGPVLPDRPVCGFPPFPPRTPKFRRSHRFWLYDRSGALCTETLKEEMMGMERKTSKRLVSAEIQLLKSKCANLANVFV